MKTWNQIPDSVAIEIYERAYRDYYELADLFGTNYNIVQRIKKRKGRFEKLTENCELDITLPESIQKYPRLLNLDNLTNNQIASILSYIDTTQTDTLCYRWLGSVNTSGYPNYNSKLIQTSSYVNRLIYKLFVGEIPDNNLVRHSIYCEDRTGDGCGKLCVNPEHLSIGNHQDNFDDRMAAGNFNNGKLSADEVIHVFKSHIPSKVLAETYDVHVETIRNIRKGKTYKRIIKEWQSRDKQLPL